MKPHLNTFSYNSELKRTLQSKINNLYNIKNLTHLKILYILKV